MRGRCLIAMGALALLLSACAVSPSTVGSGSVSQSAQSLDAGPPLSQSGAERRKIERLERVEDANLPFDLWSTDGATGGPVPIAGAEGPLLARDGKKFSTIGTTRGGSDCKVLTMVDGERAFGSGTSPSISRETVGLIDTRGDFTAWSETPGIQDPQMLPGAAPFQSLNATGAASSGSVVVWMSVGAGGKQWSLMAWDLTRGSVTELASSASMTLGFTGISATVTPGLEPPEVNGRYAYFQVAIPQNVYDAATPGMRFHEIEVTGKESPDFGVAVFRVALDAPGDVVFVGPSAQINADQGAVEGIFWATSPGASVDAAQTDATVEDFPDRQSGSELSGDDNRSPTGQSGPLGEKDLGYRRLLEQSIKAFIPDSEQPNLVMWTDSRAIQPLLGVGPASTWAISDMDTSLDYLVVAVTKMSVVTGTPGPEIEGPPSWVIAVDLNTGAVVGAAKSEVAVPDIFVSGDLVVWGAAADLTAASAEAIGEVTETGASDGFVWRIGTDTVYQLPSENQVVGPQIAGDVIAIRQVDHNGQTGWSFLRWLEP